jgi:6-phosphogluconate dehydrogenase (decarboxylating)
VHAAVEEVVPASVLILAFCTRFRFREAESLAEKLRSAKRMGIGGQGGAKLS